MKRKARKAPAKHPAKRVHTAPVKDIDPDGDIRMHVGEGENEMTLLVNRHTLCLSSLVFRTMLGKGGRFIEAHSVDGETAELTLMDDDPHHMEVLMSIIHLQGSEVPSKISWEDFLGFARLCDKYDLRRSLGAYPDLWANDFLSCIEKPGFECWLLIAYAFKLVEPFERITRRLIKHTSPSKGTYGVEIVDGMGTTYFSEGVPDAIIGRNFVRHKQSVKVLIIRRKITPEEISLYCKAQDHFVGRLQRHQM